MNIQQLMKIAKSITNPQQAIKYSLLELEKVDPQKARSIAKLISMGKEPKEAIKESAQKGQLNLNQLEKLKSGYKYLKGLGIKINVPQETWNEVEEIIKNSSSGSPIIGGGF